VKIPPKDAAWQKSHSAAGSIADAQLERKLMICARKLLMRQEERGFGTALRNTGVAVCDRAERRKIRGAKPSLMAEHLRPDQPHNDLPKLGRRSRRHWTLGLACLNYGDDRPCLHDLRVRFDRRSDAPDVAQCIKGKIEM